MVEITSTSWVLLSLQFNFEASRHLFSMAISHFHYWEKSQQLTFSFSLSFQGYRELSQNLEIVTPLDGKVDFLIAQFYKGDVYLD